MATERWAESLKYSEEVINSNEYELIGINGHTTHGEARSTDTVTFHFRRRQFKEGVSKFNVSRKD